MPKKRKLVERHWGLRVRATELEPEHFAGIHGEAFLFRTRARATAFKPRWNASAELKRHTAIVRVELREL